jgi:hypothetical protein
MTHVLLTFVPGSFEIRQVSDPQYVLPFSAQDLKLLPREKAHCLMLTLSDFGRIDVKIGNAQALQFPGTKDEQIQGKDGGKALNSMNIYIYNIYIHIKYDIKPRVLWGTTVMISHQGYIF